MNDLAQRIRRRYSALKTERSGMFEVWQEISDYVYPFRGRYSVTDRNLKNRKHSSKILDSTPLRSQRTLSAGLMSGMTSPARQWFALTVADKDLSKNHRVKSWCHDVSEIMNRIFSKSNTYRVLHTIYDELGLFGTGVAVITGHYDNVIHGHALTAGEYCIAPNQFGEVDTLYREYQMTTKAIYEMFGESCPARILDAYNKGQWDTYHTIINAIEPRDERDTFSPRAINMPFRSVYITEQGELLKESGYKNFPAVAPRWHVLDTYGISPAMEALPDIKQLQIQQLRKAQGIDQMNNPTKILPDSMKNKGAALLAGGILYASAADAQSIRSAFSIQPDLQALVMDIQETQKRINSAFYADLFMMFEGNTQQMTATEVAERQSEKMLMLGPVLERLDNELLSPLIERTFDRMLEDDLVPAIPDELNGIEIIVEYTSVLAQAQKMTNVQSQQRFVASLGQIAQLNQEALDKFNVDAAIDDLADSLGINPKTIVSSKEVALIRQQRAQAQQAEQEAMAQAQQVQNMKTMGDTNMNNIGDIMNSLQGYAGAEGEGLQ